MCAPVFHTGKLTDPHKRILRCDLRHPHRRSGHKGIHKVGEVARPAVAYVELGDPHHALVRDYIAVPVSSTHEVWKEVWNVTNAMA